MEFPSRKLKAFKGKEENEAIAWLAEHNGTF